MNFNNLSKPYLDRYPNLFSDIEAERLRLVANGNKWHKACYIPIGAVANLLKFDQKSKIAQIMIAANATALAAWRVGGKHIIKFDKTVEAALIEGGIKGNVPMHIFEQLPFMCAYIVVSDDPVIKGFFVHLEHDLKSNALELRFVVESQKEEIFDTVLDLSAKGTIEQVVKQTMRNIRSIDPEIANTVVTEISGLMHRILPLVLYLCSVGDDTKELQSPATIPALPRKNRAMAVPQPKMWNMGERIGAAIRASAVQEAKAEPTGKGSPKRAHIRRGHYHTYRVGKGRTKEISKWLYPMPINADDGSEMPTTIRQV